MIQLPDILNGDRRQLAKAVTLIESTTKEDRKKAKKLLASLPENPNAIRLGISGVPGVGKSTFVEGLGQHITKTLNKKVAVLTIDPTSPISGGSLLGDKTRMEVLAAEEKAFIRPSPTKEHLGGVSATTKELILLFEAAGYDYIIIETVGVGQSEFEARNMVDLFLWLTIPNTGDGLQAIKKGLLELIDIAVVNKTDLFSETDVNLKLQNLGSIFSSHSRKPIVSKINSLNIESFKELYNQIKTHYDKNKAAIKSQRQEQLQVWKKQLLEKEILASLNYTELLEKKISETKDQSISELFSYLQK